MAGSLWAASAVQGAGCAGTLDTSFDARSGISPLWSEPLPIRRLVVQPDGKLVMAGELTLVQGLARRSIARLNPDGSLDLGFAPRLDGPVEDIVLQPDGKLLITGGFTNVNFLKAPGIARLNPDGTTDPGLVCEREDISSRALGLAPSGGFFVGCRLPSTGADRPLYSVTRLDPAGRPVPGWSTSWSSSQPVFSLVAEGETQVLVNGVYRLRGGNAHEDFSSALPPALEVLCVARQSDGKTILGGRRDPNAEDADVVQALVRLNPDGSRDQTFAGPVEIGMTPAGWGARHWLAIRAIKVDDAGRIYVAGFFTTAQGAPRTLVARLEPDGSLDEGFVPDFSICTGCDIDMVEMISALDLQAGGNLYVGGVLSRINGMPRISVARLNTAAEGCGGILRFATSSLRVNESAGNVSLTVLREGNTDAPVMVVYSTYDVGEFGAFCGEPSLAEPVADYASRNAVVTFAPGEVQKTITIDIHDDKVAESNEYFGVELREPTAGAVLTSDPRAWVVIVDDETAGGPGSLDEGFRSNLASLGRMTQWRALLRQPDGRLLVSAEFETGPNRSTNLFVRLNADGQIEGQLAVDGAVEALAADRQGTLVAGDFAQVNGVLRRGLARLGTDGSLDLAFDAGLDGKVDQLTVCNDGSILIGGEFTQAGRVERQHLARLDATGAIVSGFDPGRLCADSTIRALAALPDGKVLIAGWLRKTYGLPSIQAACLNKDGSVDETFATEAFRDGWINQFVLQPDGNLLVAGYLPDFNGQWGTIGRIYPDGTPDPEFAVSDNGGAQCVSLHPDGKVLVNGRVRLLPDGTRDRVFFTGAGAGSPGVAQSLILPDGNILIGGPFRGVNGIECPYLARLRGGTSLGAGWFELVSDSLQVQEDAGAARLRVRRLGGAEGAVTVPYQTVAETATPGKDFTAQSGEVHFAAGEQAEQLILIPLLHDPELREDRSFRVALGAPSAGALAQQNAADIVITDAEVGVRFAQAWFSIGEGSTAILALVRVGQLDLPFTVQFSTADGSGRAGQDYVATERTISFGSRMGLTSVEIPIPHNYQALQNRTVLLRLSSATAGVVLAEPSSAVLNVIDTDRPLRLGILSLDPVSGRCRLRFDVPPGQLFELQGSLDLVDWATIYTGYSPQEGELPVFVDPDSDLYRRRFYRLAVPH